MNSAGTFSNGIRSKEYSAKDIPVFSGRLLPEFDKRRTIRDMFVKQATSSRPLSAIAELLVPGPSPTCDVAIASARGPQAFALAPPQASAEFRPLPELKRKASGAPSQPDTKQTKPVSRRTGSGTTKTHAKAQQSLVGFLAPKPVVTAAHNADHEREKADLIAGEKPAGSYGDNS